MNTEDRVELLKEYFDKLVYTDEPKELIQIGREINEFEVELNIVLLFYLFIYFCFPFFN
jgi:hypothetical protein